MLSANHRNAGHHVYLLDTMNNVLGIFIFVLILTLVVGATATRSDPDVLNKYHSISRQLGLSDAQITASFETQLRSQATARAEKVEIMKRRLQNSLNQDGDLQMSTADSIARARQITASLPRPPAKKDLDHQLAGFQAGAEQMAHLLTDAQTQLKTLLEQAKASEQVADFSRAQASTEKFKPDHVVRLVLRQGKIACLNGESLSRVIGENGVQPYIAHAKERGESPTIDGLVTYFNSTERGDDTFTVTMETVGGGSGFAVITHPRFGQTWINAADLKGETAWLKQALNQFDSKTTVVDFDAWGDSFDNYVQMNRLAQSLGYQTTWVPYADDEELREVIFPGQQQQSNDQTWHVQHRQH